MTDDAPRWMIARLDRLDTRLDNIIEKLDRYNGMRSRVAIVLWGLGVIYMGIIGWAVTTALAK